MPKSVAQEYSLVKNNGNTLWEYAIYKEMKDVIPAFRKIDNGEIVPIGYQRVNCHIIFDVKMEYFLRKARLVSGGHMTDNPSIIAYTSLMSREIVRIDLKLAALNDFPVKVADIQNA